MFLKSSRTLIRIITFYELLALAVVMILAVPVFIFVILDISTRTIVLVMFGVNVTTLFVTSTLLVQLNSRARHMEEMSFMVWHDLEQTIERGLRNYARREDGSVLPQEDLEAVIHRALRLYEEGRR